MTMATKHGNSDAHKLPKFTLRMPPELLTRLEAAADERNKSKTWMDPTSTVTSEILRRLASSFGLGPVVGGPQLTMKVPTSRTAGTRKRARKAGGKAAAK